MKAVETVDLLALDKAKPAQKVAKVKKPETKIATKAPTKSKAKPKTFSLEGRHEEQINAMAMGLSQKRGKPVGASEALRYMLDQIDGKISA